MVFTPFSGFNRFAQNPIGRLGFSKSRLRNFNQKREVKGTENLPLLI
jgi:hypothetical protein